MRKTLQIGTVQDLKEPASTNGQIILGRDGNGVWLQNCELIPKNKFSFKLEKGVLTIEIKLNEGEYVAVKDVKGMADKEWVCEKDN